MPKKGESTKTNDQQYELVLVGGSVRDKILQRDVHDYDYVVLTKLSFQELCLHLESEGYKIFKSKPEFLTIRCKTPKGQVIDIVYPRVDKKYSDGRRPDNVETTEDLKQDASRRDFTINAMYVNNKNQLYDPFNGMQDIRNKMIRCVGDPEKRFQEDYLRMIRAIRFSVVLDFEIEKDTERAIMDNVDNIIKIARERIIEELNKALSINSTKTYELLYKYNILSILTMMGINLEATIKNIKK